MIDFCCLLQTKKNSCLGTSHPVSGIIKQWYPFPFSFLFLRRVPVPVTTNNSPLYEISQIVCLTNLFYTQSYNLPRGQSYRIRYVLYSDLYFTQNQVYKPRIIINPVFCCTFIILYRLYALLYYTKYYCSIAPVYFNTGTKYNRLIRILYGYIILSTGTKIYRCKASSSGVQGLDLALHFVLPGAHKAMEPATGSSWGQQYIYIYCSSILYKSIGWVSR